MSRDPEGMRGILPRFHVPPHFPRFNNSGVTAARERVKLNPGIKDRRGRLVEIYRRPVCSPLASSYVRARRVRNCDGRSIDRSIDRSRRDRVLGGYNCIKFSFIGNSLPRYKGAAGGIR